MFHNRISVIITIVSERHARATVSAEQTPAASEMRRVSSGRSSFSMAKPGVSVSGGKLTVTVTRYGFNLQWKFNQFHLRENNAFHIVLSVF